MGSNPAAVTSLRNFDNSVYPSMPVSFGGNTKSRPSLLSGVYARGSKISHPSALEMCNLSWTPHSSLEKYNSLNHSCVSPKMGCLEYNQSIKQSKHLFHTLIIKYLFHTLIIKYNLLNLVKYSRRINVGKGKVEV